MGHGYYKCHSEATLKDLRIHTRGLCCLGLTRGIVLNAGDCIWIKTLTEWNGWLKGKPIKRVQKQWNGRDGWKNWVYLAWNRINFLVSNSKVRNIWSCWYSSTGKTQDHWNRVPRGFHLRSWCGMDWPPRQWALPPQLPRHPDTTIYEACCTPSNAGFYDVSERWA